ncbi:MAG: LacI family transcriptional regulator [Blastochloris sp.]|nr:LacI family transcriptional regulator [Blastochloris sp.]
MTQHLLDLGHRQILYFSGPPTASSSAEHMTGFRRALMSAGLEPSDASVFLAGFDIADGEQAMLRALSEKTPFTAIVCVNDAVAIGALQVLRKHKYSVPADVSVVGYGDGPMAAHASIPLTTVRQPRLDLGRAAFQLWHQKKKRGNLPTQ